MLDNSEISDLKNEDVTTIENRDSLDKRSSSKTSRRKKAPLYSKKKKNSSK